MKIHFIISALNTGGAERVAALIANSLAQNKANDVSIITFYKEEATDYPLNSAINRIKLNPPKIIGGSNIKNIIGLVKFYKNKGNRPDIIISYMTLTNLVAILVAKLFSIKIISQEHNSYLRNMQGRKALSIFTKKYIYRFADVITVLTSFDIQFYSKYGINTYVMPNPCSFNPIKNNSHERSRQILAVGNLDRYHHKGLDNLIKLIVPIFQNHPDWKLIIAGSGDKGGPEFLKDLARKYNVSKNIQFTGFISNISDYMVDSSIFILPSRYEGLPMVLLEAMSQGMACIAYDCKTGPSDIIQNNKNGLLIEDQNMSKMQKGLSELIENSDLRKRLSNEGIKSLQTYNIKNVTELHENLIKKVTNTH